MIEEALLALPAVTGAQAVGQPDQRASEGPVADVRVNDRTVTEDHLRAWAAAHVSEAAAAPQGRPTPSTRSPPPRSASRTSCRSEPTPPAGCRPMSSPASTPWKASAPRPAPVR
ncbi:hypothetical protein ABZZ80_12170 [Streptomyces sp. NPDC006356]